MVGHSFSQLGVCCFVQGSRLSCGIEGGREFWGLYHEAEFADKFQFSLQQSWVLGTMKVAWLLVALIAIATYTPQLTCSGTDYVLS